MATPLVVRKITDDDLADVLSINNSNTPAVGVIDMEQLQFLIQHSQHALVVADETVKAFCITLGPGTPYQSPNYLWFASRYTHFVYLDRIAVAGGFQGQGLGSMLYEEVETQMSNSHPGAVLCCEVNVEPPNPGSLRFHQRIGFTEVGQFAPKPDYIVSLMVKAP
jgi:predicted GNAT superfamily acetyltransferase